MKITAIILLILSAPISIIIVLLIYFQSKSSAIFTQKRVGKDKIEFTIYKFKSMDNNKITTIGRVIRKLGLDEIPQLYNIIKGDMSFVGPRPLTQFDIVRLGWNKKQHSQRWHVKPGITGLAQLTNVCDADLSLQNDLDYVRNKSFFLDFKIILRSLTVPFLGKHTK